jgi:hypothetical protein
LGFEWIRALPVGGDYRFSLGSTVHYMSAFNVSTAENPVASFNGQTLLDAHSAPLLAYDGKIEALDAHVARAVPPPLARVIQK